MNMHNLLLYARIITNFAHASLIPCACMHSCGMLFCVGLHYTRGKSEGVLFVPKVRN